MKTITRPSCAITAAIFFLFAAADSTVLIRNAAGRAGRGDGYRSSGSSSSSTSSSGSSWRSSSSSSSSSSSRSSGYSSSSTPYTPRNYDDDFSFNSWSAVLRVDRSGAVDVTETYDVTTTRTQRGILRKMNYQYNSLWIYNVACDQGYATYGFSDTSGHQFAFGYYDERAPGRHVFTLRYRVSGMVVPSGRGARLQWRWEAEKLTKAGVITVVLPPGSTPLRARAVETMTWDNYVRAQIELHCAVTGNVITVPVNRDLILTKLDISADLPAGVIYREPLRANLAREVNAKQNPSLLEYRTSVTIHEDRTIDREDSYRTAPDNAVTAMTMWCDKRFNTALWAAGCKSDSPEFVDNTLYLYGFEKKPCGKDNFTSGSVCVPLEKSGQSVLRYSLWGNFSRNGPFFFDFRLPPSSSTWTDRVRFEVTFPSFVKKELVKAQLRLVRGFDRGSQLDEVAFEHGWEGNRLIVEYSASLFDDQHLLARIFLPPAGFKEPERSQKMKIYLSNYWYFNRIFFIGALVLAALLLGSVPALIWFIKKKMAALRAAAAAPPQVVVNQDDLGAVRSGDPNFSSDAFLARALAIAQKIQAAWSDGNMAPVRNLVSQGVYSRFRLQLRLMREQERLENLVDGFAARTLILLSPSLSHAYQTLHVHMDASARDITVPVTMPAEEKKRRLAKAKRSRFTEIYSFTRKRGAVTDPSKNILAGQCPNCGTVPASFGDSNRCGSCGTIYNSGEFDWVLSEITQGVEWKNDSSREVPGLSALEKESLSLNRGVIEDRASCLFWLWIAGQAAGNAALLARDATAKFLGEFKPAARYFANTAVGSADMQEVASAAGEARAVVLVLWSAAFAPGREPEHRENMVTLALPLHMKSPYGFADHGCDACGAPLPESDAQNCSYCGGALQKVNSDWLLDGVADRG